MSLARDLTAVSPGQPLPSEGGTASAPFQLLLAGRGALAVGFGLAAELSPVLELRGLALAFAVYLLLQAALTGAAAWWAAGRAETWGLLVLECALALEAGGAALLTPRLGLGSLVALMGVWAIMTGATLTASGLRGGSRTLEIACGAAVALWGAALVLCMPATLPALMDWLGGYGLIVATMLATLVGQWWGWR